MTTDVTMPPPDIRPDHEEQGDAVRDFASRTAHHQVWNSRLFLLIVFLLIANCGLVYGIRQAWMRPAERLYIVSDASGRAQVVRPESLANRPSEANLRYFFTQFANHYWSRRKASIARDLPRSLAFLDSPLASSARTEWESSDLLKKVSSGTNDQEVEVSQVVLRQMERAPYEAEIDFAVVTMDASSRTKLETRSYTATLRFVLVDKIPNSLIVHNPIGLVITYLRTDESFAGEKE